MKFKTAAKKMISATVAGMMVVSLGNFSSGGVLSFLTGHLRISARSLRMTRAFRLIFSVTRMQIQRRRLHPALLPGQWQM